MSDYAPRVPSVTNGFVEFWKAAEELGIAYDVRLASTSENRIEDEVDSVAVVVGYLHGQAHTTTFPSPCLLRKLADALDKRSPR